MAGFAGLAVLVAMVAQTSLAPAVDDAPPTRLGVMRAAAVCTRTRRENCEELDRYCVFNDCLLVRNDNNKYRTCARSCSDALLECEAGCDVH